METDDSKKNEIVKVDKGDLEEKKASPQVDVEELMRGQGHIQVNHILIQVLEKSDDVQEGMAASREFLKLAQEYEDAILSNYKARAEVTIDIKTRDPDEIIKRKDAATKRMLKWCIGACTFAALIAAGSSIFVGSGVVVAASLAAVGGIGIAVLGPLATGESMSTSDIVRIFRALPFANGRNEQKSEDERPKKKRKGKKK